MDPTPHSVASAGDHLATAVVVVITAPISFLALLVEFLRWVVDVALRLLMGGRS